MLEKVGTPDKKLELYRGIIDDSLYDEVIQLGRELRSVRLCHISSTPFGGGIPEILFSIVPVEYDAGIQADWYALHGNEQFLQIAKKLHNGLQGNAIEISEEEKDTYLKYNRDIAADFPVDNYDVVIIHNHHLLPIPDFVKSNSIKWIWRNHLDTSSPEPDSWQFLKNFLQKYNHAVFTMKEFLPHDFITPRASVIAPAIDPLSLKNRDLPLDKCSDFVGSLGIDTNRPIILHVSRLDYWKDPLGIINCYRMAKDEIPDLQLVIITSLSPDDLETFSTLRIVDAESSRDQDIHVYTNIDGMGDIEVNVFQRASAMGIMKSLREGFGLSVSESLWKEKPVLGSRVGGIPMQLSGELEYCLVDSVEDCSKKIKNLIIDPENARSLGKYGKEHVRKNFLSPRLIRDELAMIKSVVA